MKNYVDADPFGCSLVVHATRDYTTPEIAEHFNVHYTTASRTVKHSEENI